MEVISTYRWIYLIIFLVSFIIGCVVFKYHRALRILLAVMALGLLTEFIVEFNKYLELSTESFIYNIYIPLEYILYAAFFYFVNVNKTLRKSILISIPVFVIMISVMKVFKVASASGLATNVYTISGILITIWSIWTLFVLPLIEDVKFTNHPLIWICAGLIIFYSGITPFNLAYNALISTESFEPLSRNIQKGFNIFLYVSLTIGFICSNRLKT